MCCTSATDLIAETVIKSVSPVISAGLTLFISVPYRILGLMNLSSPIPGGYLIGGRNVVAELAMLKAPFGRFSRLSSLHLCVLAKSANVHFRQRRKFTALPCSSYPQRATARRGPHKPAALGFGLFSHVQIYCQAGVFPKRGVAPFWSVGGGCREGKSKSPPCRFFEFLNRFFALKEMV